MSKPSNTDLAIYLGKMLMNDSYSYEQNTIIMILIILTQIIIIIIIMNNIHKCTVTFTSALLVNALGKA